MLIDFIRQVNAAKKFKLADTFDFVGFEDMTQEGITEDNPTPDQLEIWAAIKIQYNGEIPESYRVLNFLIGDWVIAHEKQLTAVVHHQLLDHFSKNYPDSEVELNEEDTAIWTEQLDYMPRIDEATKTMIIDSELVLLAEPLED